MNHPYNRQSGMAQGGGVNSAAGGGYNRWYDLDGSLSGSSASSVGGGNNNSMMSITNGLAGLGLTGSPSSMSPNKGPGSQQQQPGGQQQQQQPPPPHHVNGSGAMMGEDERKIMRAIGTERSWKYGGGFGGTGGGAGPIGPPPSSGMGGQMDTDPMALWMMLEKAAGGVGNPQMPMHGSWMSSHNNNNNQGNKSRPPSFMPEPDLHLQDPYNVSKV